MAARRIECVLPQRGVVAVIEVLAEAAAAGEALGRHLPLTTDTYHTKWNGQQIFVVLPMLADLALENQTSAVEEGDVVLFHRSATYRAAPRHLRAEGLGAYVELALCYGAYTRTFGPSGDEVGMRLGRIVEGREPLREAALAMRRAGFEAMRLRHG